MGDREEYRSRQTFDRYGDRYDNRYGDRFSDRDDVRDRHERETYRDRERDRDVERGYGRVHDDKSSQPFPFMSRHNATNLRPQRQVKRSGNKARITVEHVLKPKSKADDYDDYDEPQGYNDTTRRGRRATKYNLAPGMLPDPSISRSRSRSRSRSSIRSSFSHTASSVAKRINKAWRRLSHRKQKEIRAELDPDLSGEMNGIDNRELRPEDAVDEQPAQPEGRREDDAEVEDDGKALSKNDDGAADDVDQPKARLIDEMDEPVNERFLRKLNPGHGSANGIRKHDNDTNVDRTLLSDGQSRASITSHGSYNASEYNFNIPEEALPPVVDKEPLAEPPADRPISRKSSRHVVSRPEQPIVEVPVMRSRWVDQSFERGNLSVELAVQPQDRAAGANHSRTSMVWYHLQRKNMNFEEFVSISQDVAHVTSEERRQIAKLLRHSKLKHEKQRQHGRSMNAHCTSDVFYEDLNERFKKPSGSIAFLCLPYFTVEKLVGDKSNHLPPGSPLHHSRPLLQGHFLTGSRKRELAQAVTSLPDTSSGHCIHTSQLWCLVVNHDMIITCSTPSVESLGQDLIAIQPSYIGPRPAVMPENPGAVTVLDTIGRRWRIEEDACKTWPSFITCFSGGVSDCPEFIEFRHKGEMLTGDRWPAVLDESRKASVEIEVRNPLISRGRDEPLSEFEVSRMLWDDYAKIRQDASDSEEDVDGGILEPKVSRSQDEGQAGTFSMHLFATKDSQPANVGSWDIAEKLHIILSTNPRSREKKAYERCVTGSAEDVESWLASLSITKENDSIPADKSTQILRRKREIALVAKRLVTLFWPPGLDHTMLSKFWGALNKFCTQQGDFFQSADKDDGDKLRVIHEYYRVLFNLALLATAISNSYAGSNEITKPGSSEFMQGWLHIVTAFVMIAEHTDSLGIRFPFSTAQTHLEDAYNSIIDGDRLVTDELRTVDLGDLEMALPSDIAALLLYGLTTDGTDNHVEVCSTYREYFQRLEFEITEAPLLRKHEETLRSFMQEIEAVSATFESQLSVLNAFKDCLKPQRFDEGLPTTDNFPKPNQRGEELVGRSQSHLEYSIEQMTALAGAATHIGRWQSSQMASNKDDQEAAIMTFTVVTVIFLPLSFVASVFGMNTRDIRELQLGQWIYWTAALPLTFAVVLGSLWWVGGFEGIIDRTLRALQNLKTRSDYNRSLDKSVRWADEPDQDKEKISVRRHYTSPSEGYSVGDEDSFERPERIRKDHSPPPYRRSARSSDEPGTIVFRERSRHVPANVRRRSVDYRVVERERGGV